LSGKPVKPLALKTVARFYLRTQGKIPIVGCGGISSAQDVIEYMQAGASVVQLYTALAYQGPGLIREIKNDLTTYCHQHGLQHVQQLTGTQAQRWSKIIRT
jgi:dihydroorotate dehydrogenase